MRSARIAPWLVMLATLSVVATACGPGASASPRRSAEGSAAASAPSGEAVEIRWYCCLGAGDAPEQVEVENAVVEAFNASHPNIHLTLEVVPYDAAYDTLATQIGAGNPPDIVGPLGIGGANAFPGQWLDLTEQIEATGYDLSQFPENTVEIYQLGEEGQVGIPFAIYPSALWYKKSHFEEAQLNEPPHVWGDPYVMPDGTEVEWNYDTVREIAMLLTVDENNNDATSPDFDPDNVVQWGFEPQRDDMRQVGAYWEAGRLVSDDGTTAQIPDSWAAAWTWWYAGMWEDHFSMTGAQFESTDLNPEGYPFFTGNVSMSQNYLWSKYGVSGAGDDWDLAASPSYQGNITAAFNADTFRIMKDTEHPAEAFEVLTYLLGEASGDLLNTYGGMPARPEEQDAYFATISEDFTQEVDWQVIIDGAQYADNPNFESPMPAYNEALTVLDTFGTRWQTEAGLDLEQEFEDLRAQLQEVFDAAQ
ncbi:MAG: ABC transporter substrate-binding protein [Candidatus Limnocylindria bacterium]